MPRIPSAQTKAPFPGVEINPNLVATPLRAMAQAGERVADIGQRFTQIQAQLEERETKLERQTKVQEFDYLFADEFDKLATELDQDNDIDGMEKKYKPKVDQVFEGYRKQATVKGEPDQVLDVSYQKLFKQYELKFNSAIRRKRVKVLTERGQLGFLRRQDEYVQDIASAPDDRTRQMLFERFELEANATIGTLFSAEQVHKMVNELPKRSQEAEITGALGSKDEKYIQSVMTKLDLHKFDKLDVKEEAIYKKSLVEHQDKIKKELEEQRDKEAVDAAYQTLKNPTLTANHYPTMYRFLADPDWLKRNNLDVKRKGELETRLKQEQSLSEQQDKKYHDDIENEFSIALSKGTLTPKQVDEVNPIYLTGDEKFKWKERIRTTSERQEPIDPVQEAQEYARINGLVNTKTSTYEARDATIDEITKSKKIKPEQKRTFIDRITKNESEDLKKGKELANKYLEAMIVTQLGQTLAITRIPQDYEDYVIATKVVEKWVDDQGKAGKIPSSNEILEYAMKIAPSYQKSIPERMRRLKEYLSATPEKSVEKIESQEGKTLPIQRK